MRKKLIFRTLAVILFQNVCIECRFITGSENVLFAGMRARVQMCLCVCVCVCAFLSPEILQAGAVMGLKACKV